MDGFLIISKGIFWEFQSTIKEIQDYLWEFSVNSEGNILDNKDDIFYEIVKWTLEDLLK